MRCILVLTRPRPGTPPPPESWPVGRAALALEAQGLRLRFGGLRAIPGGWAPCDDVPFAIYDRFPSWTHPQEYQQALAAFPGLPVINSLAVQALCRDKLATQQALEAAGVAMPPVSDAPSQALLGEWGGGFLKPRYGGLGRGVRWVKPGDPLPETLPGATGDPEPAILQAPVLPRSGEPFVSYRALVQRAPETERRSSPWVVAPIVARVGSAPVVNVDLGAAAEPACDLLSPTLYGRMEETAIAAAEALADEHTAELGVDLLVDSAGGIRVIEVNGVPKGRGAILARRDPKKFAASYEAALVRPLAWAQCFRCFRSQD